MNLYFYSFLSKNIMIMWFNLSIFDKSPNNKLACGIITNNNKDNDFSNVVIIINDN
jgi:hypothetical protein